MTATEFRQTHGDPTTWTTADHETYEQIAAADRRNAYNLCARRWNTATTLRRHNAASRGSRRLRELLAPAA